MAPWRCWCDQNQSVFFLRVCEFIVLLLSITLKLSGVNIR